MTRPGPVPSPSSRRGSIVALLIAAAVAACSPVRAIEAVRLLRDVAAAQPERFAETVARRREVVYEVDGPARRADLYPPEGTAAAALVLVPGAAEEGRRDPRLVAFAGDLNRAGFLVLVPELAGDDPLRASAADALAIADAVRYLSAAAGVPEVGAAALSYAVGPAVLAAISEEARTRVGFILAIGGYHDIVAGITYLTTGAYRAGPGEPWRYGDADPRAKWLFLLANADRLDDPSDARRLAAIARRRLNDPDADIAALVARLGSEGRTAYRLLANDDPDRVPELIAALPAPLREEIAALDLARRDLGRLEAELILVHGRNDPMVPYTESLALARAVPPDRAHVFVVDGLRHVDLGGFALGDALTLVRAAYRLLAARDAAPAPEPQPRPRSSDGQQGRARDRPGSRQPV